MSAIKVDIENFNIAESAIINTLVDNNRYEDYSKEVIKNITSDVVKKYKKSLQLDKRSTKLVFDDEELFDEIYDYMLKKTSEMYSSADIAYIVNDIFMQVEDMLFDEGTVEYNN